MLADPVGVVVLADATLVVSDLQSGGNGALIAVDPGNGEQRLLAASTVFQQPMGVCLAPNGDIVVSYLMGTIAVMQVNPRSGEFHAVAPGLSLAAPSGVAVDRFGSVFVTDADIAGGGTVFRVDPGVGTSLLARNEPPGSIYTGIAVDRDDAPIVISTGVPGGHSVLFRVDRTNGAVTPIARDGSLTNSFGVALEQDGSIIVVDNRSGVIRVDPNSGQQNTVSFGGNFVRPMGIAIQR